MVVLEYVSSAIAAVAAIVVAWGVILGVIALVRNEVRKFRSGIAASIDVKVRHTVGSYLLLGLEFLIAADIIRSVIEPTLEELAILGGIVAIRTVVSYFLEKEMGER
ncbi:MAG: DUF1622 domain-containing protein [Dehalococcoidia bacterium]|nr:DUF1622 domain-containing protein [Dehalococcoidia bacterium]